MAGKKIAGLERNTKFADSALLIMNHLYRNVIKKVKAFLDVRNVESLHELRISIRRFRYTLENYGQCFDKKKFKKILNHSKKLQDLLGEVRDIDILEEKIALIENEIQLGIPESFFEHLNKKKDFLYQEVIVDLMKFLHNKQIRNFFK